jgi:hypothetical protein
VNRFGFHGEPVEGIVARFGVSCAASQAVWFASLRPAILLNFDLHNHSNASDGLLDPRSLVELAARNGCDGFALTDHDTVAGLDEAASAAALTDMRFVPGVEISVTWPDESRPSALSDTRAVTLHIVGLNIDAQNPVLNAGLQSIRTGRRERATRIAADLAAAGIPDTLDAAYDLAANADMIGRTHFARVLAMRGHANNVGHAFTRYLTAGKPGYVAHRWASLADAVTWIRAAGGVAVLAHPGRYKLDRAERRLLFAAFVAAGGGAAEVVTGSHEPRQYAEFAALTREFGLKASRGADYHGPGESRHQPGTMPPLPTGLTPVWDAFED